MLHANDTWGGHRWCHALNGKNKGKQTRPLPARRAGDWMEKSTGFQNTRELVTTTELRGVGDVFTIVYRTMEQCDHVTRLSQLQAEMLKCLPVINLDLSQPARTGSDRGGSWKSLRLLPGLKKCAPQNSQAFPQKPS